LDLSLDFLKEIRGVFFGGFFFFLFFSSCRGELHGYFTDNFMDRLREVTKPSSGAKF
jgi:hypothetical protein